MRAFAKDLYLVPGESQGAWFAVERSDLLLSHWLDARARRQVSPFPFLRLLQTRGRFQTCV